MKSSMLGTFLCGLLLAACARHSHPVVADGDSKPAIGEEPKTIAEGDERSGDDWGIVGDPSYERVVRRVVGMVDDGRIRDGANRRGLDLVNLTWEDTGRAQGSALGPNISDLTLQVRYRLSAEDPEKTALMPVIRFPNFTDRSADVSADKLLVRVGNHRHADRLESVPLTDVLRDLPRYLSRPWSVHGGGNLLSKRDTHFLVSAQAVFLPIPKSGKAEFNPVVFNYQSAPDSPAVLTLLVTRQGTSVTVIENRPEDSTVSGWGQELYFNDEGQRAAFTAERKGDVEARIARQGGPKSGDDKSALSRGADVLMLIQVPLKHANRGYLGGLGGVADMPAPMAASPAPSGASMADEEAPAQKSDVEQAVLGHGKRRGPFQEGRELTLERDESFPIRITVQFYKATSNGVADEKDLDAIARSIGDVYEHADYVGSLVIPEGDPKRPTAWQKRAWFPW